MVCTLNFHVMLFSCGLVITLGSIGTAIQGGHSFICEKNTSKEEKATYIYVNLSVS